MTNENYLKCKTCRFCVHSMDKWDCSISGSPVAPDSTCGRYRPGCCESCSRLMMERDPTVCMLTGDETDILSVCSDYDPCGRRSV